MVRRSNRRRGNRGGRSRRGRSARQIRQALNAPRQRVRPRNVIRTGPGHGTIGLNSLRRITIFPKRIVKADATKKDWWIQSLKWVGNIAMQLITVLLTDEAFAQHKLLHSGPSFDTGSSVVGCIQSFLMGPSDLVAPTQIAKKSANGLGSAIYFRQGRIMHLRISIIPSATIDKRGGTIAMACIPVTIGENLELNKDIWEKELWTFDDVCQLPNAVVKSTTTGISMTWSPKPGDWGYSWTELGTPILQTTTEAMDDSVLRVLVAYMDMSSNSSDVTAEYSLTESAFEMVLDGRVEVREVSDGRFVRAVPIHTRATGDFLVLDYARKYTRSLTDSVYHEGVLYHHAYDDDDIQFPMTE